MLATDSIITPTSGLITSTKWPREPYIIRTYPIERSVHAAASLFRRSAVWRVLVVLNPSYSIPWHCARLLTPGTSGLFTTIIKLILEDSLSETATSKDCPYN